MDTPSAAYIQAAEDNPEDIAGTVEACTRPALDTLAEPFLDIRDTPADNLVPSVVAAGIVVVPQPR